MKVSPTKATTVISRTGRTTLRSLGCEVRKFRGNTYNRDSTPHEADMNS
jgi:hypothetical protein